jgi:hypothetical protein
MSTIKVTNIQHPSAESPAIELTAEGTVALPLFGIGDLVDVDEGSGAADGDVLTYDGSSSLWLPQPGLAGIGSNVVQTVKTDRFTTTSTSFTPVTGLTATITPTSASSLVLVIADFVVGHTSAGGLSAQTRLLRDSTPVYEGTSVSSRTAALQGFQGSTEIAVRQTAVYLDSPATTSATTYSIEARTNNASFLTSINGTYTDANSSVSARTASSVTLIEVAA